MAGNGEVRRISAHRTVWKLAVDDGDSAARQWLLKVYHPRRPMERMRRLLKRAPAMREKENWDLLAHRMGMVIPIFAEQPQADIGLLARPFFRGRNARQWVTSRDDLSHLVQGMAGLHAAHWSDSDIAADDLLFVEELNHALLPIDLGHAKVSLMQPPVETIYRDLERLLASLPPQYAVKLAAAFLPAKPYRTWFKDFDSQTLVKRSLQNRSEHAWKRSRRCLRLVSNFQADKTSSRRDGFADSPPEANSEARKSGPRSSTHCVAQTAWKHYPRSGTAQQWRRQMQLGPACQAFRKMYFLELLGFAVAPVQAWLAGDHGEWMATKWLDGGSPSLEQLPQIAIYLAKLHAAGVGLRDAKPSNFVFAAPQEATTATNSNTGLHLIDADGIRPQLRQPWRDLARVIAEVPADSDIERQCLRSYAEARREWTGASAETWMEAELHRLTAKDAEYFRGLLADQRTPE